VKWTSTILSIVFLLLSCLPCADKDETFSSLKVSEYSSSKQHHDNDTCSPFCVCNCCGTQSVAYNAIYNFDFVLYKKIVDKQLPEYKSVFISNFLGSIWQPPQIV
jgi:hypothetical protein